jgi:hypothetical protein
MERSKQSEEAIIKLGEKLVKELDLVDSKNTLARWMAHYLAELIENIDKAESKKEKKILQKECCDVILKVWSQKESLPIRRPLVDLKPVVEMLKVLKEKKEISILPRWLEYNKLPRDNQWASFVDLVKNNSEKIFNKVLQMNLHKDILCKDEEWMKNNKELLSKEELRFLEFIDVISKNNKNESGVIDLNNFELSDDNKQRVEFMFNELENLIVEQKRELLKIKKGYKASGKG